jgi:PTH1 family peptidyl-tRNA hydrolase
MTIRLIAGLGNPGAGYSETRHNAGFWFVDALAARGLGAGPASWSSEGRFKGHAAKVAAPGLAAGGLWLLKPDTFMNRSGASVQPMCHFYQIATEEILVVHDELDLPPGQIRLKQGGGHGGHNGIRDIAAALGDANFWRLRLGIGHPRTLGLAQAVADFVLQRPRPEESTSLGQAIDRAVQALPCLIRGDAVAAQRLLHVDPPTQPSP